MTFHCLPKGLGWDSGSQPLTAGLGSLPAQEQRDFSGSCLQIGELLQVLSPTLHPLLPHLHISLIPPLSPLDSPSAKGFRLRTSRHAFLLRRLPPTPPPESSSRLCAPPQLVWVAQIPNQPGPGALHRLIIREAGDPSQGQLLAQNGHQ